MDARDVVAQRITTLDGLLASPSGPFAGGGGPLAERLAEGWRAERRLLRRILDETRGSDVRATIGLWNERTAAFLERSAEGAASWHDRDGHVWDAGDVLRILEDLTRRIDTWLTEDDRSGPGPEAVSADAIPAGARRGVPPMQGMPGEHGPDAGTGLLGDADEDEDLPVFDPDDIDDDDDDDDDDARYVRVNEPTGRP